MVHAQLVQSRAVDSTIPPILHSDKGYSPEWMLIGPYSAHDWTVRNIGNKPPRVLTFNVKIPNGGVLSDYPNLYESVKRIAYGVRTGPLAEVESADVQATIVSNLTTLACWMISRGIKRFSDLTKADREEYACAAVYGVHNVLNTESILERHLENLIAEANFHADDDLETRRWKAMRVFPVRKKANQSINSAVLDRMAILSDAGLGTFAANGRSGVLITLLDETEALCMLYQPGFIKARTKKSQSKEVNNNPEPEFLGQGNANNSVDSVIIDRDTSSNQYIDQAGATKTDNRRVPRQGKANTLSEIKQPDQTEAALAQSKDDYDDKPVSEEHLRRFLMSFQYLYDHRRYLEDALTSAPFFSRSARAEAQKLGREVGRTGTIPVAQATCLIERSVRWVLDYAPTLLALYSHAEIVYEADPGRAAVKYAEHLDSFRTWPTGPASPFPIVPTRISDTGESSNEQSRAESLRDGMSLHSAILFLMTACAVVIAAFSARRASEIIGLKAGCVHIDDSGQPWLECFIHKTLKTESRIPVPEVVVAAVNVLEKLSERARRLTGEPYVFQYNVPGSDRTYGISEMNFPVFRLAENLRKFGYFVDVPRLEDGTPWTFKPHQFRRFFAILYIWIYDKGDWGALQYHLRHFTSEMTRRYASENEIGQIIAQVDKEHTANILASAALGLTYIGGSEGTRLKQVAQRLHAQMAKHTDVVSPRKYKQKLERLVERTGVSLTGFPWGYCVLRKAHKKRHCNCTNSSEPDHGQASEITCTGCAFSMVTPSAQSSLINAIKFHQETAESEDSPAILREASRAIHQKLIAALAETQCPLPQGDPDD
jgi:integrase